MTTSFDKAVSHAMLYEVGKFWNESHPAVANGLIDTPANRKAVGYVNDKADRGGETKFGVAKNGMPLSEFIIVGTGCKHIVMSLRRFRQNQR